ncbi:gastrula zinc finger protein XlCGF49.1-like, partial [Notechis scutatus]|uniref:Gastrula zinc finger protein XlCGF49.1-like n=1 Tax=Notechis scutatus TaxID=8663 RepID=A0A6J1WDF4_9SAUR
MMQEDGGAAQEEEKESGSRGAALPGPVAGSPGDGGERPRGPWAAGRMSPGRPRQRRLPGGRCKEKDTSEDPETGLEGGGSVRRPGRPRRTQEEGKRFQCPECEKSFTTNGNLKVHLNIHSRDQSFKCLECGKSFNYRSNLSTHQIIHTGEKPHKCLECGKSFSLKHHLYKHQKTHSGEKPYKCLDCGKSF